MKFEKVSFEQYFKDECPKNISESDISECREVLKGEWDNIILPKRATKYSAAYDLYSPTDFTLNEGFTITLSLGIKANLDRDKGFFIIPRSGVGFKYGIELWNTIGLIDCDFYNNPTNEGNIKLKLHNAGNNGAWVVKAGDAIAQGIIIKYYTTEDDIPGGERIGGTGSTSRKE